jgi:uncharacterized membrane protein YhaH (DUF805 family)
MNNPAAFYSAFSIVAVVVVFVTLAAGLIGAIVMFNKNYLLPPKDDLHKKRCYWSFVWAGAAMFLASLCVFVVGFVVMLKEYPYFHDVGNAQSFYQMFLASFIYMIIAFGLFIIFFVCLCLVAKFAAKHAQVEEKMPSK